jgi:hypothetical protein
VNQIRRFRVLEQLFGLPAVDVEDQSEKFEIVDLLREPLRGLADGVLSPTLTGLAPPPVRRIVGNLSNHGVMLLALGAVP